MWEARSASSRQSTSGSSARSGRPPTSTAPEQRSIYLLTEKYPFLGFDPCRPDTYEMVLENPPVPLRAFRPDAPEGLERVLLKALKKEPRNRFKSAQAMWRACGRLSLGAPPEGRMRTEGPCPSTVSLNRLAGTPRNTAQPRETGIARHLDNRNHRTTASSPPTVSLRSRGGFVFVEFGKPPTVSLRSRGGFVFVEFGEETHKEDRSNRRVKTSKLKPRQW